MDLKLVILLQIIIFVVQAKSPQVYENVDETPSRIVEPNHRRLNFLDQKQMDQQKWRYHQQQQIDQIHRFRNQYSSPNGRKTPNLRKREIPLNYGLSHAENIKLLQEQEQEIQALSALIGKNPSIQLEGLKQLLGPKDHTPIIEETPDVANPQSHPNVKVEPARPNQSRIKQENLIRIAQIQNELNVVAHAQAQEAIAKAQQEALADVQAQHKKLQAAQAQAQKEIQAIYRMPQRETKAFYGHDSRFNQQDEIETQDQKEIQVIYGPQAQKENQIYYGHGPQAQVVYGHGPRLNEAETQEENQALYDHGSRFVQPTTLAEVESQHKSLAQAQTETQALYGHGPSLVQYKPVLTEDSKKTYGENKDLQYASQYAFGYRVRDYHSGNHFGHEEISDGKTAKGHYHVLLPDGRMQNVQYWADETGFHAKVTYDKAAQH